MSVTIEQLEKRFGDPRLERGMILFDIPSELEIGVIPKRVYCNALIVKPLGNALKNLIISGAVRELKTWDGCFNIRPSKGNGAHLSLHAYGYAIDVNAAWNRYGHPPVLSRSFINCFTEESFLWGGFWHTPDGMHFEYGKLP
jgi:hypothetical protein